MKAFQLIPSIAEYADFAALASEMHLGARDLILTNEYIYNPTIADLDLGCHTCFQEKYGAVEPTDVMVDAILDDLRGKDYDRIVAVGGGTVIDIAKALCVAGRGDTVDDLYARMADLKKEHGLVIVPTTCGTGSEVTNISIINRTTKGVKVGLVSPSMFADEAALVPAMLASLPYPVFATSSIDAMVHAVESYLSPNACPISELFSEKALQLILRGWKDAVASGSRDGWKKHALDFLRASNFAGIAFGHAGCAAVHAMAYPLGGVHHIPHGQANQLMFADVMRKYQEKKPVGKLNQLEELLAKELDVEPVEAAKGFHRKLRRSKRRSVLAAVLAAAAVCLGGTAAADVERPVPYQDGLITAEMAYDQVIDVYYYGGSYSSIRGFSRTWEGRNTVFLEYTKTIKSGLIPVEIPAHASIGNGLLLDSEKGDVFHVDREIQAVYYLTGDYDALLQMEEGEFAQAAEDAVLLWESE